MFDNNKLGEIRPNQLITTFGPGSIVDEKELQISKFECEYRATRRDELSGLLLESGCSKVKWLFPEETGFYQPIVLAKK